MESVDNELQLHLAHTPETGSAIKHTDMTKVVRFYSDQRVYMYHKSPVLAGGTQ